MFLAVQIRFDFGELRVIHSYFFLLVQKKVCKKKDTTSTELASCSDLEDIGFLIVDASSALLVDALARRRVC